MKTDKTSDLARKTFDCEFKAIDDATGTFSMYALVFGNVDRGGDRIRQGAVQNVDELVKDGWIALNHNEAALPIATIDTAIQDQHGLKLDGTFHSTPEAQAVRTIAKERMERGKSVKTSIGYRIPDDGAQYVREDGQTIRDIEKMSVYEASFVNLPMNPLAEVQQVKSLKEGNDPKEELMSDTAVVKALKRVLGLSTKSSYKVDGEEMEKAKGVSEKCAMHAKAAAAHFKSAKESSEACSGAHEELMKCFKNFTSGQQQDVDKENDGDDAEERDKDEPEEDTEDDEQEDDSEAKALKAYRLDLQRQILNLELPSLTD